MHSVVGSDAARSRARKGANVTPTLRGFVPNAKANSGRWAVWLGVLEQNSGTSKQYALDKEIRALKALLRRVRMLMKL